MRIMWNGILPIGSIVLLEGGDRKLMVTGTYATKEGDDSHVYDYAGVLYPDGLESLDHIYLFNRERIVQVFYVGYMDEKSEEYLPQIETILDAAKNGGEQ